MTGASNERFAIFDAAVGARALRRLRSDRSSRVALEAGWILGAITTARPELEGITLRGPVWRSVSSTIFLAEGDPQGPIAVKICFEPGRQYPSETAARRQYEALERASVLSSGELLMPAPLGLLPRHGIVLTEWIDGDRLTDVIVRSDRSTAGAVMSGAAGWIARLHGSGSGEWKPLHTGQLTQDLRRRLERLRRPDPLIVEALGVLTMLEDHIVTQPVRWGPVHGDFKPDNVLMTPSRQIAVLDIELHESGPALTDLAQFLNHLKLSGSGSPRGSNARAPALSSAFLDAYFIASGGHVIPTQPLRWLQLAGALRLLSGHAHGWTELLRAVSILRTRKLIRGIIRDCND